MGKNKNKQFIDSFFGKHFSEKGHQAFGAWLRADGNKDEKEKAFQELWESSKGISYASTHNDWRQLRARIEVQTKSKRISFFKALTKYAAVILLMLMSASAAWFAKEDKQLKTATLQEYYTALGENKEITLPDGSKTWLSAGTILIYPQDFDYQPKRLIYLSGKAYFDVAKNSKKPFIVRTPQLDVLALGTRFTVEAYLNDSEMKATLEEGSIQVDIHSSYEQPYILQPGEQLIYDEENKLTEIKQIDLEHFDLMRNGFLVFNNATIDQLVKELERKYKVNFQYNSSKYSNVLYNVKFAPNETLADALNILKELTDMQYSIKGKNVYLK